MAQAVVAPFIRKTDEGQLRVQEMFMQAFILALLRQSELVVRAGSPSRVRTLNR